MVKILFLPWPLYSLNEDGAVDYLSVIDLSQDLTLDQDSEPVRLPLGPRAIPAYNGGCLLWMGMDGATGSDSRTRDDS